MDFATYRPLAMRTLNPSVAVDPRGRLLNGALGLLGETGEIADLLKKMLFQGHPLDLDRLQDELGDVCWYLALLVDTLDQELPMPPTESHWSDPEELPALLGMLAEHVTSVVTLVTRTRYTIEYPHRPWLGGILTAVAALGDALGYPLEEILERNVAKLARRYPDGFAVERSLAR